MFCGQGASSGASADIPIISVHSYAMRMHHLEVFDVSGGTDVLPEKCLPAVAVELLEEYERQDLMKSLLPDSDIIIKSHSVAATGDSINVGAEFRLFGFQYASGTNPRAQSLVHPVSLDTFEMEVNDRHLKNQFVKYGDVPDARDLPAAIQVFANLLALKRDKTITYREYVHTRVMYILVIMSQHCSVGERMLSDLLCISTYNTLVICTNGRTQWYGVK